ncbi:hypothetical protein T492DRAFT_455834 [Pavlovales sp. CCMP2436]|nr:hypothetical protein T492DRAFT_455834 [Pavlovales sp. CCMP2436]
MCSGVKLAGAFGTMRDWTSRRSGAPAASTRSSTRSPSRRCAFVILPLTPNPPPSQSLSGSLGCALLKKEEEKSSTNTNTSTNSQAPEAMLGPDWQRRLAESVSEGASGCFFYRVRHADGSDSGFLVKQITAVEKRTLLRILPAYREHVISRRGHTLLHYYGCHSVRLRWVASARIYFVVMRNFAPVSPYLVFDLKGATANRRYARVVAAVFIWLVMWCGTYLVIDLRGNRQPQ